MAFRLSGENVRMIEHDVLGDIDFWAIEEKDMEKYLGYVAGIHDMANVVIKAIKELGGR